MSKAKYLELLRKYRSLFVLAGIAAFLAAAYMITMQIMAMSDKQTLTGDLTNVAQKIELYKQKNGVYPSSETLKTVFASDPEFQPALTGKAADYPSGLNMTKNYFYCVQDEPARYILFAAKTNEYSMYVTNNMEFHEIDKRRESASDQKNVKLHLHASAAADVCPVLLPGFTDSTNGRGDNDNDYSGNNWAPWTGIRN